jgi:hypothetical protein
MTSFRRPSTILPVKYRLRNGRIIELDECISTGKSGGLASNLWMDIGRPKASVVLKSSCDQVRARVVPRFVDEF